MKSYKYIARDPSGQRREGFKESASSNDLLGWLREQGLTPVSVAETSENAPKAGLAKLSKRIKSSDLSALCWQLTTMVEGGVAIPAALETISEDVENLYLRKILKQILEKMLKGETFSSSILEYPKVFNRLAYAMILAGETSGNLSEVLRRLAGYFDNRDKLTRKVKGAMAYPIFVLGFIALIIIFIMSFIIPRFSVMFTQMGNKLPAFTRGFMAVYNVLYHNLHYIIGTVIFIIVFSVLVSKTQKGHSILSRVALSVPLFGRVIKQAFVVTFCRTMSTLVAAGVSVLDVFDILSGMTDNEVIKSAVVHTKERIVGGLNISLSMSAVGFFPNMVVKMIQVGEESGSLASVLERTSEHYERKVDSTITFMTGMLEPIMIVTVGAIVLVVVLAMYLPIFSMSDVAK